MRPYFGLALIIVGVLVLSIRSITFFTTDTHVGPLGFFAWDVTHPHTIFINPLAGILALVVGVVLLMAPRRALTA